MRRLRYASLYNWDMSRDVSIFNINLSIEEERIKFLEDIQNIISFDEIDEELFKPCI